MEENNNKKVNLIFLILSILGLALSSMLLFQKMNGGVGGISMQDLLEVINNGIDSDYIEATISDFKWSLLRLNVSIIGGWIAFVLSLIGVIGFGVYALEDADISYTKWQEKGKFTKLFKTAVIIAIILLIIGFISKVGIMDTYYGEWDTLVETEIQQMKIQPCGCIIF